jgi:hypothetical protein
VSTKARAKRKENEEKGAREKGETKKSKKNKFRYRESNPGFMGESHVCCRLHHIGMVEVGSENLLGHIV